MRANTIEVEGLFDKDTRYLVPIFQRNYKWTRSEQWEPLWLDVRAVATDVLDQDEREIPDHFLGAIVCEQVPVYGRDAQAQSVIDGQQRLTTLQLLFAGARRACLRRGLENDAAYVTQLLENRETVVRGREAHRFKLYPNVADRPGYARAMHGGEGATRPEEAVRYFASAIERWLDVGIEDDPLDDEDHTPEQRMDALLTALARHVKIVKIDLEPLDNAQVIFETLNARGEPLTDADLIRNYLFRRADEEGLDPEDLHLRYWSQFEDARWSLRVAHGRHQRGRLDLFLSHWLSLAMSDEVPASRLFPEFRRWVEATKQPSEPLAKEIARYAEVFDTMEQHPIDSREWWFFRRLVEMDLITVYPVLLWLYGQDPDALPAENRIRVLVAMESFLSRRLLARESTRSYGALFIEVLKTALTGAPADVDARVIELLASKQADADRWPTDEQFRSAVLHTNAYALRRSRLRMILEAADRELVEGGRTETVDLGNALWIEHLLPQGWRSVEQWSLGPSDDPTAAGLERDHILHTLGNLTLTTSRLDIELSNRPWPVKVHELQRHSSLALNRTVCSRWPHEWNETTIRARGLALADLLTLVWPGPEQMSAEVASRA